MGSGRDFVSQPVAAAAAASATDHNAASTDTSIYNTFLHRDRLLKRFMYTWGEPTAHQFCARHPCCSVRCATSLHAKSAFLTLDLQGAIGLPASAVVYVMGKK